MATQNQKYPLICRHAKMPIYICSTALVIVLSDTIVVYYSKTGTIKVLQTLSVDRAVERTIENVDKQTWLSLSIQEAIEYLDDNNVPTRNFISLAGFAADGTIKMVDKPGVDPLAGANKRRDENLRSIFG